MIITQTPLRVSFFGGGSDYPSWYNNKDNFGEVISCTIDKYIYISLKETENFSKNKYFLKYSKTENVDSVNKIKHKVIRKAFRYFKINRNLELQSNSDIPAKAGMGTSSAFTVGLIKTINTLNKNKISQKKLAEFSTFFEHKILKEAVGSQDQYAACYGGFNCFKFSGNKVQIKKYDIGQNYFKKLNQNLFLVFTGKTNFSREIVMKFTPLLTSKKKKIIKNILNHVQQAKNIIKNNELDNFGYLLDETWQQKKQIYRSISNSIIDHNYNIGRQNGALGGKLLGAGGRGFILFYVPRKNQDYFLNKFPKKAILPFKFTNNSSKIILE